MLFIREDIPSNLAEAEAEPIDGFYIELNLIRNNITRNLNILQINKIDVSYSLLSNILALLSNLLLK